MIIKEESIKGIFIKIMMIKKEKNKNNMNINSNNDLVSYINPC